MSAESTLRGRRHGCLILLASMAVTLACIVGAVWAASR